MVMYNLYYVNKGACPTIRLLILRQPLCFLAAKLYLDFTLLAWHLLQTLILLPSRSISYKSLMPVALQTGQVPLP